MQRRSPCRGYGRSSPEYELGTNTLLYLIKLPEVIADLALVPLIFFATRRAARLLPEAQHFPVDALVPLG